MNSVFTLVHGATPLLVSIPHAGTRVPAAIDSSLTEPARALPDTDWFVSQLYRWVADMGASLLVANYSRYVIDLNRPPDDAVLYPSGSTGLLPRQTFAGQPIYRQGLQPDQLSARHRLERYWQPYHNMLETELAALQQRHGHAVLLDAHSIRSEVPRLFAGRLADLNLGSNAGLSADTALIAAAMTLLESRDEFDVVLDGRFKGGFITRHYGQPLSGIHALQLEIAQSVYMREQPPVFEKTRAREIEPVLKGLVKLLIAWRP